MFRIRPATAREVEYYSTVLYPVQNEILNAVGKKFGSAFYLTGGTALSRFYFRHRLSEDLDLFTAEENIKTALPIIVREIENLGYSVEVERSTVSFGRLYVHVDRKSKLKIDLAADRPLENPRKVENFYLDTLKNIAVNKIVAFEDRAELKDLVDLCFIVKEGKVELDEILDLADEKRVPVPYEELLAVNALGLTGSVFMLKEISEEDLKEFLEDLKETLEENVKKKLSETDPEEIVRELLWDLPYEERKLSPYTLPLLKRRMKRLGFVKRERLKRVIDRTT